MHELALLAVLVAALALAGLAQWRRKHRLLRSIARLTLALRATNSAELRPLGLLAGAPRETRLLLAALDGAFARMRDFVASEKRFVTTVAHELRTPLAAIRAHAQLAAGSGSAAETGASLAAILRDIDRASRLIEQLLDLARVEALPGESLHWSCVALEDVLRDALHDLQRNASRKDVRLHADLQAKQMTGLGYCVELMVRNLLSNSIQYCGIGGEVKIASRAERDGVALVIDDSGPGIPAAERLSAFEPFNRLGRSGNDGVGLGLAIVLRIVELHKASIRLSQGPLGGLRVELWFPCSPAARGAGTEQA